MGQETQFLSGMSIVTWDFKDFVQLPILRKLEQIDILRKRSSFVLGLVPHWRPNWRPTGAPQWFRKLQLTKTGGKVAQSPAGISKSPGNGGGWYIVNFPWSLMTLKV